MEGFFTWLSDDSIAKISVLFTFVFFIFTMMIIYLIAFFQGREISFWLPKIGTIPNQKLEVFEAEAQPIRRKSTIDISGLQDITFKNQDIVWEDLFENVNELDLFFAYASLWRTTNEVRLLKLAKKKGIKIRLILPDTSNLIVLHDLARRFNKTPERLKVKVEEAKEQFEHLALIASSNNGATIEVYLYNLSHHYALYRFDNTYIFSIYQQRLDKAYVPHFICKKEGELADFFNIELNSMVSQKVSRRII